jgi:hypothetical protein
MKLPGALKVLNAELSRRREHGLSEELETVEVVALRDDHVGLFLRLKVHFAGGDIFTIDTQEASELLRPLVTH